MNQTSGVVYSLSWLTVIQKASSLAELKVVAAVWGYDGVIGIDTEPLTFTELLNRTNLTKKSLTDGLKRCLAAGWIEVLEQKVNKYYVPGVKSKPHEHDHVLIHESLINHDIFESEHEHEGESKLRQEVYLVLLDEFGMTKSTRIAQDICFSPRYDLARLRHQIRCTRWEVKRGQDGNGNKPIRNPAGRLVYRLRHNEPTPKDFNLEKAMIEDEGWTREALYWAIYNGDLDISAVKESFEYAAWVYELHEADDEQE